MTNVFDALVAARRSIRKYTDRTVPESHIREMILSANTAPSPSNQQPVRYVRLVSPEVRHRLSTRMETGYREMVNRAEALSKPRKAINVLNHYWRHSRFMWDAPALFAVGGETGGERFSTRLNRAGIPAGDALGGTDGDITIGLSLQLFMLRAVALGLGTCILTAPLHFLDGEHPVPGLDPLGLRCFLTLGFPDEAPAGPGRKSPEEIYWEA